MSPLLPLLVRTFVASSQSSTYMNKRFPLLIALIGTLIIPSLIFGCASSKQTSKFTSSTSVDSSSVTLVVQSGVGQSVVSSDSILALLQQRDSLHHTSSENSTEQITETITTMFDSLGREIRTEQRSINRTSDRQTELFLQQWQQQQTEQYNRLISRFDSLSRIQSEQAHVHWNDSISNHEVKEPTSYRWYDEILLAIARPLAGIAIIALLVLLVRYLIRRFVKQV